MNEKSGYYATIASAEGLTENKHQTFLFIFLLHLRYITYVISGFPFIFERIHEFINQLTSFFENFEIWKHILWKKCAFLEKKREPLCK